MPRPPLHPEPAGKDLVGLTEPPSWNDVFGFEGPLELEIGCGAGGFAVEYARRHPGVRLVAFEWRKKYARFTQFRADQLRLTNLKVIEGDAKFEVPHLFAPGSLSGIHLQFPDPWWKRSHQKRAVLSPAFAQLFHDLMAVGGIFDLRTDVEERAHQMLELLEGVGFVNPLGKGTFHPYDPESVPSTRERRYLISGEPVYRANLVRARAAVAEVERGSLMGSESGK